MRKVYFFFSLLLAFFGAASVQAEDVVTAIGSPITSLSQLSEGARVLIYCQGQIDPAHYEYGTRSAFVKEQTDGSMVLSRQLELDASSNVAFIWTVEGLTDQGDGTISVKLKGNSGNYVTTFSGNNAQGQTGTSADVFTIEPNAEAGDTIFGIKDVNGIYFNGKNIDGQGGMGDPATFVGWSEAGGNSNYMIYLPTLEDKDLLSVSLTCLTTEWEPIPGYEETIEKVATAGEVLTAPEIPNHTFNRAEDANTGEEVEFPYTVEDNAELFLYYEPWPYVTLNLVDEDGNPIAASVEGYYEPGSTLVIPNVFGYELVNTEYEGYVVNEDDIITLIFRKGGLPFVPTTVADGEFADGTKWYTMKIRSTKYLQYAEGGAVNCVSSVDTDDESILWCFTGNETEGYKIYNKAAGAGMILWAASSANAEALVMTEESSATEPNTFELGGNGDGFYFKLFGTSNSYANDFGGEGILKFWSSDAGISDAGSRIVFTEYDPIAMALAAYASYLSTEDCVGGWTAEQLSDLKTAYENQDVDGCEAAMGVLAATDTIAFDANKRYAIVSAFEGYLTQQPGKVYAMCANGEQVSWAEYDASPAFEWVFKTVEGTDSVTIYNVDAAAYIGDFRFGGTAPLGSDLVAYQISKSEYALAGYNLIHNYGASIITLSAQQGPGVATATSGNITTYNTTNATIDNIWRFKAVGDATAISSAAVSNGSQQNAVYDLSGRRVLNPAKGIYIVNGKKVYVK